MTRVRINLAVFALLAVVTIAWSFASLFDIDRLDRPYHVTAEFESSPGLRSGFQVTYLGTQIGTVKSVALEPGMSIVTLRIDRDVEIPADVTAQARRQSAIGEPYVNLSPRELTDTESGPRLADGANIGIEDTTIPINYEDLFTAFDDLVNAVDPSEVEILVDELAAALDGRGDELRSLVLGARDLSDDLVTNADEIDALLVDLGDMAGLAAEHSDSIESSLDALTEVSSSLDEIDAGFREVLVDAPPFVALLNRIFEQGDAGLLCTLDGLASLETIVTPEVLAALTTGLENADETRAFVDAIVKEDGFGQFDFTIADGTTVYPERVPQPVAPQVPGCPAFGSTFTAADEASVAGPGPGGEAPSADGVAQVPPPREQNDAELAGSSDLGQPDEPFLSRIFDWILPAVAFALLAAAGWFLFGLVRDRRRET